ncbi:hypothetical protein ABPG74_004342 [Tetrahymena malaccensis]
MRTLFEDLSLNQQFENSIQNLQNQQSSINTTKQIDYNNPDDKTNSFIQVNQSKDFSISQDIPMIGQLQKSFLHKNQKENLKMSLEGDAPLNSNSVMNSKNYVSKSSIGGFQNKQIYNVAKSLSQFEDVFNLDQGIKNNNEQQQKIQISNSKLDKMGGQEKIQQILKCLIIDKKQKSTNSAVNKNLSWNQSFLISRFLYKMKKMIQGRTLTNLTVSKLNMIGDACTFNTNSISSLWFQQNNFNDSSYFKFWKIRDFIQFVAVQIPVMEPDSFISLITSFIFFITSLLLIILTPMEIAFEPFYEKNQNFLNIIHFIIYAVLIIEILVCLNTGIYKKGAIIMNRKVILQKYLSTRFLQDFLVMFIITLSFRQYDLGEIRLLLIVRLTNLKQLYEQIEEFYQLTQNQIAVSQFIKLLSFIIMASHIFGCMFYIIGKNNSDQKNWINITGINQLTWFEQYIASVYWSMVTICTVGYGDIVPTNARERIFVYFVILISSTITGYAINKVGEILDQFDIHQRKQQQKQNIEGQMILENISYNLQCQYKLDVYGKLLKNKEQLKNIFSDQFFDEISLKIEEKTFMPEEIIYTKGDPSDKFYIIIEGKIELLPIESQLKQQISPSLIQFLHKGDIFGYEDFICQNTRKFIAVSKTKTYAGIVSYQQFYDTLKKYQKEYEKFCMIRDNANHQKVLDTPVSMKCLCCNQKDHQIMYCPCIHFTANTKSLINKFKYCKDQKRQEYSNRKGKKLKSTQIFQDLKKAQIKIKQNTELLKEFKKGIEKKEKDQQDKSSSSCFSENSDTFTSSSNQTANQQQGEQCTSQNKINEIKSHTKIQQEQEQLNQEFIQKSISNADTNSIQNKTFNSINLEENIIKKSKQLQFIKQKSRDQLKQQQVQAQMQNSILINENISIHEPSEGSIYQRQEELDNVEVQFQGKKSNQEILENNLNCLDLKSFNNFNQIQQEEKIPSSAYFPDLNSKVIKFQEDNQSQNSSKQQQLLTHHRQSVSKHVKRKSEYFKNKKAIQTIQALQYEIIQNMNLQISPKIQKQDEDLGDQKLDKFQQLNEFQLVLLNKRREDMNQRFQQERQSKLLLENSFFIFDSLKSFKHYFPHNNLSQVLNSLSQYKLKKGIQQKKLLIKRAFKTKKIN